MQSSSPEKKIGKASKNYIFGPKLHYKEVSMGLAQNEKQFSFGWNNKSRSSAFRNFLFYKNIICFGRVLNLFLFCVMFFYQKGPFPAKIAVSRNQVFSYKRDEMLEFWWWSWRNYRTLNVNKFMLLSQTWKGLLIRDIRDWLSISW